MSEVNVSGSGEVATSTPSATPTTPVTATPVTSASPVATPQTSQTPASGVSTEDRSSWVPPHRIRETREAAIRQAQETYGRQVAEVRAEAERYRQQVMALTGVQAPPNPEISAVRDQFGRLYPGLAKMEEKADVIEKLVEQANNLEAQSTHYWGQHAQRTMDRVFEKASTALGSPLNDGAKKYLYNSFVGFTQSSPELTERYANDPSIVDEFINLITSNLIDPVRRSASATVSGRANAALPQDTPSGSVRAGSPAPKFQNLDERVAAGWAIMNQDRNKV